jgi:hypothetical protein
VTSETRAEIEEVQLTIGQSTDRSWLRALLRQTTESIDELRKLAEITVPRDQLLILLDDAETQAPGRANFLPKFLVDRMAPGMAKLSPDHDTIPAHALIELDYGQNRSKPSFEVHILEASLFEDLCGLFNQAHALHLKRPSSPFQDKLAAKTADALNRATVTSAFYLVEAYLNGIAAAHVITAGSKIKQRDLDLLTEWNGAKKTRQYVRFRDKLVNYPRIVAGLEHPPLQENNCPELRFVVETAKELRDAIVHASAHPNREYGLDKWRRYNDITFSEAEQAVDQVIRLIRLIEVTIRGNVAMLSWLEDRTDDGTFPARIQLRNFRVQHPKYRPAASAARRPSAIAHTTNDCPLRASPAAKIPGTDVA